MTSNSLSPALSRVETPSDESEASGPATVPCSCGEAVVPAGRGQCPACGRFLPRNEASLIHGSRREGGRLAPLDMLRRSELRAAVLADLGGPGEVSAVLAELVDDFSNAVTLRDMLYAHLAIVGPLTQSGRRRAVLDAYLASSVRVERLAGQIGTGRRTKPAATLADWARERVEGEQ